MIYWTGFALICIVAYFLPGYAALSCIELDGIGRLNRLLLALPTSLIIVPFLLVAASDFVAFVPALWQLLALSLLLGLCGLILRARRRVARIKVFSRNPDGLRESRQEWVLVLGFCAVFAAITCLPRLDALLQGDLASTVGPQDASWQVARAVSVARSGLPPSHYFLPDLKLVYYFWSEVYPALLSNQPLIHVSTAQAVTIATWFQTLAFLAVFYTFLCLNFRSLFARIGGMLLTTVMGGLDLFATLGNGLADREWWQTTVPWIANGFQISSPITWFVWVPQHVAAAMAFVICLIVWRNVRGSNLVRSVAIGLLFAFAFGTSAWVFLSMVVGITLWFLLSRGWKLVRGGAPFAAVALGVFSLGSWRQILIERTNAAALGFANYRVPLLEIYLGIHTARAQLLDHLLTVLGAPVVLSWVFLVEMGSAFVLYLCFLAGRRFGRSTWERFLVVFPLVYSVLVLVFRSSDNTNNLVMRGIIPAQICMILAAVCVIDEFKWNTLRPGMKAVCAYLGLAIFLAQCVWPFEEIRWLSAPATGAVFDAKTEVRVRGLLVAEPVRWPGKLAYIDWANERTEPNAVFVEAGLSGEQAAPEFLHLERMRYMPAAAIRGTIDPSLDMSLRGLADWQAQLGSQSLLCAAATSPFVKAHGSALYYVVRGTIQAPLTTLVYQDPYVRIYLVPPSIRQECGRN